MLKLAVNSTRRFVISALAHIKFGRLCLAPPTLPSSSQIQLKGSESIGPGFAPQDPIEK